MVEEDLSHKKNHIESIRRQLQACTKEKAKYEMMYNKAREEVDKRVRGGCWRDEKKAIAVIIAQLDSRSCIFASVADIVSFFQTRCDQARKLPFPTAQPCY